MGTGRPEYTRELQPRNHAAGFGGSYSEPGAPFDMGGDYITSVVDIKILYVLLRTVLMSIPVGQTLKSRGKCSERKRLTLSTVAGRDAGTEP